MLELTDSLQLESEQSVMQDLLNEWYNQQAKKSYFVHEGDSIDDHDQIYVHSQQTCTLKQNILHI